MYLVWYLLCLCTWMSIVHVSWERALQGNTECSHSQYLKDDDCHACAINCTSLHRSVIDVCQLIDGMLHEAECGQCLSGYYFINYNGMTPVAIKRAPCRPTPCDDPNLEECAISTIVQTLLVTTAQSRSTTTKASGHPTELATVVSEAKAIVKAIGIAVGVVIIVLFAGFIIYRYTKNCENNASMVETPSTNGTNNGDDHSPTTSIILPEGEDRQQQQLDELSPLNHDNESNS